MTPGCATSSGKKEATVECGVCGFTAAESVSLAHSDAEHAMRPVHECGLCGFVFWKKFDMDQHVLCIHDTPSARPATDCMFCASSFDAPEALNIHIRETHTARQPIMCRFCGVFCYGADQVARHVRKEHASDEFLHCNREIDSETTNSLAGEAGKCGAFFMSSSALAEHSKLAHGDTPGLVGKCAERTGASSTALLMKDCDDNDPDGGDCVGENRVDSSAQDSVFAVKAGARNENNFLKQANTKEGVNPASFAAALNFSCVVCGLYLSSVKDLSNHMSTLHRTREAIPRELTEESFEAAIKDVALIPDGEKSWSKASAITSKQKRNEHTAARTSEWTDELDELFLQEIREKGFSNKTLAAFRTVYSCDRSLGSLRARGYRKGFKMRSRRKDALATQVKGCVAFAE